MKNTATFKSNAPKANLHNSSAQTNNVIVKNPIYALLSHVLVIKDIINVILIKLKIFLIS